MIDFEYYNPAKIVFGEQSEKKLKSLLAAYGVKSLLLVYSGDFIKSLGIYSVITEAVAELGIRFSEFWQVECFGVDSFNYSETERAYILSEKLVAFFKKLHLATSLAELKIDNKDFGAMAARATRNGKVGHYVPLDAAAIKDILKIAL